MTENPGIKRKMRMEKKTGDTAWRKFCKTGQAAKKLEIALEEYQKLSLAGVDSGREYEAYEKYLCFRRRSALELLVRWENLTGLRLFRDKGWISREEADGYLKLAVKENRRESSLWLLRYVREIPEDSGIWKPDSDNVEHAEWFAGTGAAYPMAEPSGDSLPRLGPWISEKEETKGQKNRICREILHVATDFLQNQMASFSSAFSLLEWRIPKAIPEWGTDGRFFYCPEDLLMEEFLKGVEAPARRYLHTLCHCMFLHMLGENGSQKLTQIWDLACDLAAEWAVDAMGVCPLDRERRRKRERWYREISPDGRVSAAAARTWLLSKPGEEIDEICREVCADSHRFWREERRDAGQLAGRWKTANFLVARQQGEEKQHAGKRGGNRTEEAVRQDGGRGDYRKFLQRLFVCREEMQVDPDSIDAISYLYGLEYYGNVLLLEPLETTETNRLEELVIAIDTSGSCSGAVVQRFLEETYGILSRRENFFRKMQVHLIQCDSMIQDHRKITCEREWKEYLTHLKIHGLGGTDFTPVFRLVDQMLERKEIRKLKGLLYFTDGDGVYPVEKPAYETAFVFPWRKPEKQPAPEWAWKLYLPEADSGEKARKGIWEQKDRTGRRNL